jgi:DNA-binding MarR family transcriptional regulator
MTEPDAVPDPVAAVEHAITHLMRQATRPAVAKWLATIGGVSLDRSDYVALARIEQHAPLRPTELSEILGVDLSTVSRQVRDLVQSGLVQRSNDPADQRACHLCLTAEGLALLARVREARQLAMRRLLADWTEPDQLTLARLVGRLADDMGREVSPEVSAPPSLAKRRS